MLLRKMNTPGSTFSGLLYTIVMLLYASISYAQPALPPRSLTVTATQSIHFGTFCLTGNAGGSVTVGWDGIRTSTGGVTLLAMAPNAQPAIFEVKLCQGRNVIITFSSTTTLTCSNGGAILLEIGPTDQGSNNATFTVGSDCNFITPLRVGGTLHIPPTTPAGTYSGGFNITFNQE